MSDTPLLISLDIETKCGIGCQEACEHALDSHRSAISVIGVVAEPTAGPSIQFTFRDVDRLRGWLASVPSYQLVGHNLKFDLRVLRAKGLDLTPHWGHDTLLMAATLTEKIPPLWLETYNIERKQLNEAGASHREAGQHSLKTLAPYFLGIAPFWETANHDNEDYVLTDCRHTLALYKVLREKLIAEESLEFYETKLLPYTKMLLDAETRGIMLDMPALEKSQLEALAAAKVAKARLDEMWAPAYETWRALQETKLKEIYDQKCMAALLKAKDAPRARARYINLHAAARAKLPSFNLDSPTQLMWLLRDHFGLDTAGFNGDETTGKATLQRLAATGRDDIATFLTYRRNQKLGQAFFPSYLAMQWGGALHCSFNPTGTRTGRLSSSTPNLQQVPGHLHKLFKARPGYKLATYDMSAIEPRIIAYYTQDKGLYDIISTGQDFHGFNTRIFFDLECDVAEIKGRFPKERDLGKEVGLALFYGAGAGRIQESAQRRGFQWGSGECRLKLERFKRAYPGVYEFRRTLEHALKEGPVSNILGRKFKLAPDEYHMKGLNTLVQGSASDLVLNSAHRIMKEFKARGIDGHVLLLVHDELVVEIPADKEAECVSIIKACMTNYTLTTSHGPVKLAVEGKVADTWEK